MKAGDMQDELSPDAFMALRLACESELSRLGLTWKSQRLRDYYARCTGRWPGGWALLADLPDAALLSLLVKLRKIPSP